jgi:hypothetical protein
MNFLRILGALVFEFVRHAALIKSALLFARILGGPTVLQNLTDSPDNQNVVLLVLQNSKSKISEKSDQN